MPGIARWIVFVERRIHNGVVELWRCDWKNRPGSPAKKVFLSKICDEQPLISEASHPAASTSAICWSYGRTLGNIAVLSPTLLGRFPEKSGNDAKLPCDLVHAGKYRHGADRWWCRTHQTHWGTKADFESFSLSGEMKCANQEQPMNYVVSPLTLNLSDYAEVGVWCSMPAALSTEIIQRRAAPSRLLWKIEKRNLWLSS